MKIGKSFTLALLVFFAIVFVSFSSWGSSGLEDKKLLTPITETQLLTTLRASYIDEKGHSPKRNQLAMAWAQVALENKRGHKVWNHNLGNLGPAPSIPTQRWYQHSRITKYRSFDDFQDSAGAYWRVVGNCSSAMQMFKAGDPASAAKALKGCGYYSADEQTYAGNLGSLYYHALTNVIPAEALEVELEQQRVEAIDYDLRHQFSPLCACSDFM